MILFTFARFVIDPFVLNLLMRAVSRAETETSYLRAFVVNLVVVAAGMGTYQLVQHYEVVAGPWIVVGAVALVMWPLCTKVFRVPWSRGLVGAAMFFGYCTLVVWTVTILRDLPMDLESAISLQYTIGDADAGWLQADFWYQGRGAAEALEE